jgi:Glycosyl hydrolase catalytic core
MTSGFRRMMLPALVLSALLAALLAPASSSARKAPPAPKGFFGVHPRTLSDAGADDYAQMGAADVGILRTGFVIGQVKAHPDDPYDWTSFDAIVTGAAANGMDLVPVLYGVPPYVSTTPSDVPLGNSESEWIDYLKNLALRYGPGGTFWALNPTLPYHPITDWQIWNEENALTNWKLKPNPHQYGRLLAISARAVHSVDPGAEIVTGGVISTPQNPKAIPGVKFLRRMLKSKAARKAADVIAIHPYTGYVRGVRKQIKLTREMLDKVKLDAPIWITEIGWGTGTTARNPLIVTAEKQQQRLRGTFRMAIKQRRRLGIGRLIWYQWRDGPDKICKWCVTSGLRQQNGTAKPLLDIFAGIARL